MNWIKNQNLLLLIVSIFVSFALFLVVDVSLGSRLVKPNILQLQDKPYVDLNGGWYELKKNFTGQDEYGSLRFSVSTDKNGFRKSGIETDHVKSDVIFLGDSFTYGINGPWEETFVGMYEKLSGVKVLNAGVASYSPTPYLYQYKKALDRKLLNKQHIVVIGLDISDVQDEATRWTWDDEMGNHPRLRNWTPQKYSITQKFRMNLSSALPMTSNIYRFVRYNVIKPLLGSPSPETTQAERELNTINLPRSAFTWQSWNMLNRTGNGYAPLGVNGGLESITERVMQINELVDDEQSKIFLLIYPWPAQLFHKDIFDWSEWTQHLCEKLTCDGVIDTIPKFRKQAIENDKWFSEFYVPGDVHFNERGNKVVAESLLKVLP
jgi:hypothetical protein